MSASELDLLLVNPGGRDKIYQELGGSLTAVEPPLWCRLIAAYVRDRGHSVAIIDSEAEGWGPESVAEKVREAAPQLVCMVVFGHQPSASTQQMAAAGESCAAIKHETPDIPILIVGGHVSALPERTLREEQVDFACKGEGPVTVTSLLEADGADLASVPGLVWRDGEEIVVNPSAPLIRDLDADLHGDAWDLLPMEKYRAHNWQCFGELDRRQPYASIYTTLGCPYKCHFCCINAPFDGNRYRMRSPDAVVAEVKRLHDDYGVRTFKIIDEMFVLNERHVVAISEGLVELGLDLNFWAYARVDTVKTEMLDLLSRAGIRWLALGIESGSKHVRDGADKALRQEDIVGIVREIQKAGINVIGNYIFGLPDDDETTMQQTLDLAQELNCEFGNFYSAMAYPGSPLYLAALANGWALPESWSGYSQHSYDCRPLPTEKVSAAEVLRFRDDAFHAYFSAPRYLDMVTQRFGWETRQHIEEMSQHRLKRSLLSEPEGALAGIDVAILAGGLGTRIREALGDTPKVLAPVGGKPFLDHVLDRLTDAGAQRVILCLGHLADQVIGHVGKRPASALGVEWEVEEAPLGTAGAIRLAAHRLSSDPVLVMNGDTWLDLDYAGFVAAYRRAGAEIAVACVRVDDTSRYGRVEIDADDRILRFDEKCDPPGPSGLVNGGVYLMSRSALARLVASQGASLERDVLPAFPTGSLVAYLTKGRFLDIGTPESLAVAATVMPQ